MANNQALELCWEIEKLPASEQQTKISVMASKLRSRLDDHRGIADGKWFVARLHPECADEGAATLDYCETYTPGSGERPIKEASI